MKTLNKIFVFSTIFLGLLISSNSNAVEFNLKNINTDTVKFESTAKLEFVSGKTNNLIGGFSFDPDNNTGLIDGKLQVDLTTIKTGIDLRDSHMRENHLHTEKYPNAYFTVEQVEGLPEKLLENIEYKGTVTGEFYLHGIKKDITSDIAVIVKSKKDNDIAIKVIANFIIKLEDYDIPHPKALFLKIAKEIAVEIIFTGYSNTEKNEIELPDWSAKP